MALHRFVKPVTPRFLNNFIALVLWPKCRVLPSRALYENAIEVHRRMQYRFYDALILASALESGAPQLYTEDLQDGRRFETLQIVNPFAQS